MTKRLADRLGLVKKVALAAAGIAAVMITAPVVRAQSAAAGTAKLSFEVVAIKPIPQPTPAPVETADNWSGMKIDGARVLIRYPPFFLVMSAFRIPSQQVVAPDFAHSEWFEFQAKLPEGATRDQIPEMLQAMLAERFKLTYHHETRDYPFTFVTVGKTGMKLTRLPGNTPSSYKETALLDGGVRITEVGKLSSLYVSGLQMVDETGLDGIYSWVREQQEQRPGMNYQDVVQEAFRNMIEDAGLKMETRKVPQDTIVVDHLEKVPTEN